MPDLVVLSIFFAWLLCLQAYSQNIVMRTSRHCCPREAASACWPPGGSGLWVHRAIQAGPPHARLVANMSGPMQIPSPPPPPLRSPPPPPPLKSPPPPPPKSPPPPAPKSAPPPPPPPPTTTPKKTPGVRPQALSLLGGPHANASFCMRLFPTGCAASQCLCILPARCMHKLSVSAFACTKVVEHLAHNK